MKPNQLPVTSWSWRTIAAIVFALVVFVLGVDTFNRIRLIGPSEVGVRLFAGKAEEGVLSSTWYYVPPLGELRTVSVAEFAQSAEILSYTKGEQTLTAQVNVTYRVTPDTARKIILDTTGNLWDDFLLPRLSSAIKDELTKLTAREAMAQRSDLERRILEEFRARSTDFVRVESFSIANFDFDEDFEKALSSTFIESQAVLRAEQTRQRVEKEAEATITKAKADAEATRIAAAAAADALQLQAAALRASPESVRLEWVRKWDGKLPQMVLGDDTSVMLPK
jgi:prohibitin 1